MLSIFEDGNGADQSARAKLSLERLRQALDPPQADMALTESVDSGVSKQAWSPVAPQVDAAFRHENAAPSEPQPPPVPIPTPAIQAEPVVPAEFERVLEQFTRNLQEAVHRAVSDVHGLVVEERRKLQRSFNTLEEEVGRLSDRLESLVRAQQPLSLKVGKVEDAMKGVSLVSGTLQELGQAYGKRLDAQADAIRTLQAALHKREEHWEKIKAALAALQDIEDNVSASENLPEGL